MGIVEVLEKKGRMELVELASLFVQDPTAIEKRYELVVETSDSECDECTQDKRESRLARRIVVKPFEVD